MNKVGSIIAQLSLIILSVLVHASPLRVLAQTSSPVSSSSSNIPRLVIQASGPSILFSLAYSSDGKYVLSGGADRTLKLWDIEAGKELRTFSGHRGWVTCAAFSPNNRLAVSGSNDKTLKLWDIATGREILTFKGSDQEVSSVAFSSTGEYLLSGSHSGGRYRLNLGGGSSGSTILWNVSTGRRIRTFTTPDGAAVAAYAVAFSPEDKYAATGGGNGEVRLWQPSSGKLLRSLTTKEQRVINSVAFSPGSRFVVAGGNGQTVVLWDVRTGIEIWSKVLKRDESTIESVAFSPDGKSFAAGGMSLEKGDTVGFLKLWDTVSGKESTAFANKSAWINSVAFSPDGHSLVSGGDDETITRSSVSTGAEISSIKGYAEGISAVATSKDGRYLLTGSGGFLPVIVEALNDVNTATKEKLFQGSMETLTLWDLSIGEVVLTLHGHHVGIASVAISPDNRYAVSSGMDGAVKLWDLSTGRELSSLVGENRNEEEDPDASRVSFSPDGRYVLGAAKNGTITLWDASTTRKHWEYRDQGDRLSAVAFSPNSQSILLDSEGRVEVLDVSTGKKIQKFESPGSDVGSVAFSSDGRYVLFGGSEDIRVLELATEKEVKNITGFPDNVGYVKFSPDGRHALLSRVNRPSQIWDITTGKATQTLWGSRVLVRSEDFSSDGRLVFSGSEDGTVRVWEVNDDKREPSSEGNASIGGFWTLASFSDRTWAVVDSAGRYDASHSGDVNGLHWVVNNEPIILKQLKERYYDPGLLAKLMGYNKRALRDVSPFREVQLYPFLEYVVPEARSTKLNIRLMDRGGGIGQVSVSVNDKEVTGDALPRLSTRRSGTAQLTVDLSNAHFSPGKANRIQVKAWNAAGYLVSRPVEHEWVPEGVAVKRQPELYAIIAGISTYASPALDLRFAAKDAEDIARALELGAKRFLGVDRVHITLLATSANPKALPPTKSNFLQAFNKARESHYEDILIVYLAGHGLVFNDRRSGDIYCYLTSEATSKNLSDPDVRAQRAITSEELISLIKQIPASKQVMILDTCAAEAVSAKFITRRAAPGEQILALERLADRTGFHILMGSSADEVSYETSKYKQGLLTYSLLLGMRGAALRSGEFVDVSQLFQYAADKVPQLARGVGGIQKPHIAAPRAESFDIGQLAAEDKAAIPLAMSHPLILAPRLTNAGKFYDDLRLGQSLRKKLIEETYISETSDGNHLKAVFVDADEMPGALLPSGSYVINGERIEVTLVLVRDNQEVTKFMIKGSIGNLSVLVEDLINKIAQESAKACCPN